MPGRGYPEGDCRKVVPELLVLQSRSHVNGILNRFPRKRKPFTRVSFLRRRLDREGDPDGTQKPTDTGVPPRPTVKGDREGPRPERRTGGEMSVLGGPTLGRREIRREGPGPTRSTPDPEGADEGTGVHFWKTEICMYPLQRPTPPHT